MSPKYISLTLLHSEWPKLYGVLTILSAIGLNCLCSESLFICHGVAHLFNPIALRKAKIVYNFMGTVVICRTVKVMVPRYSYKAK